MPFGQKFALVLLSLLTTLSSAQASVVMWDGTATVQALDGNLEYVVCTSGPALNVRDQSLSRILFQARALEKILLVQSFGTDSQERVINGTTYLFTKVQFPDRSAPLNAGWIADDFIRLRSQCPGATGSVSSSPAQDQWMFPTGKRPTESYKTGARRFGASRDNGERLHAASDLYRTDGEAALAVGSGTLIRDRYYFYLGTYALELRLTNGKILRYGEIKGKAAPGLTEGATLQSGQTVGYIGTVNSGCCSPMLHFEMYSGSSTGPLTQTGNRYNRRTDLLDPTTALTSWEKTQFGVSY